MRQLRYIESSANPKLKQLKQLIDSRKHRKQSDHFVLESPKVIRELLVKDPESVETLIYPEGTEGLEALVPENETVTEAIENWVLKKGLFSELSSVGTSQGLMALVKKPDWEKLALLKSAKNILLLDNVQDPSNLGAVLRNMKAFNMDLLLLSPDSADPFHPKSCRASAGAVLDIPVLTVTRDLLTDLSTEGAQFVMIKAEDGAPLSELKPSKKTVYVFGSKGQGISETLSTTLAQEMNAVNEHANLQSHHIQMTEETESLNLAVASGILCHHVYQCLDRQ